MNNITKVLLYELVRIYNQYDIKKNDPLPPKVQEKFDEMKEHIKNLNTRVRYMDYVKLMALIDTMPENDDNTANQLSKAVAYWCSEGEITQGMKDTLIYSVREQFEKFPEDQTQEQFDALLNILTNNE